MDKSEDPGFDSVILKKFKLSGLRKPFALALVALILLILNELMSDFIVSRYISQPASQFLNLNVLSVLAQLILLLGTASYIIFGVAGILFYLNFKNRSTERKMAAYVGSILLSMVFVTLPLSLAFPYIIAPLFQYRTYLISPYSLSITLMTFVTIPMALFLIGISAPSKGIRITVSASFILAILSYMLPKFLLKSQQVSASAAVVVSPTTFVFNPLQYISMISFVLYAISYAAETALSSKWTGVQ